MRDKRLATLAAGDEAVHSALMLRGWTDDVVVITDGAPDLSAEQRRRLDAMKVPIDERRVVELVGTDGQLTSIAFADGTRLERDGLLVEAPLHQRSQLSEQLGAACAAGPLAPDSTNVDALLRTTGPHVFAAGDNCTEQTYLAGAIAAGSQAAMTIVQSLLADQFGLPYPPDSED
jgi:thioredoxin reductase